MHEWNGLDLAKLNDQFHPRRQEAWVTDLHHYFHTRLFTRDYDLVNFGQMADERSK